MRHSAILILCLAFLTGCQASGIRGYWKNVPLIEKDIRISEDRFADFAEQAVLAPEADALSAIDVLFDRLRQDTVAYYIYTGWVDGAFYSLYSPCRNPALYGKAVERIVTDAVLQTEECEPFLKRKQWMGFNLPGERATVPGHPSFDTRTLVLVLDLSCPSCREALQKLASDPEWADASRLAVCYGYGPGPEVPGWEILMLGGDTTVFDPQLTPIYFVVAADGTVERGYTLAL